MRFFIRLAFNGTPYHGWQSQPNALGVQQVIEDALSTLLRTRTSVTGAGRTDAGVHARCMFAHFDATQPPHDPAAFIRSLNRLCGKDIAIYDLFSAPDEANARFDAVARTYKYFVSFEKNPFQYDLCWQTVPRLDFDAMNQAAAILLQTSDFTSFAKLHSDAKTNICRVSHAEWSFIHDSGIGLPQADAVFTIIADRFLRNMVRAVVGTLVMVGRHKISIPQFRQIIADKDRCSAGTSMPPQALFLWDISYPEGLLTPIHLSDSLNFSIYGPQDQNPAAHR